MARDISKDEKKPLLQAGAYTPLYASPSPGLSDRCPSQHPGCLSGVLFTWVTPLMELGNERPLEHKDLYQLDPPNRATRLSALFHGHWEAQAASSTPSLAWALAKSFGGQIARAGALKLVHDSAQFVSPMMIKDIIAFLKDPEAPLERGLLYAAIVFVAGVVQSFTLRNYFYYCFENGMRVRSAVCTAVYQKSLVLSASARQKKTTGEITNLMSIDAQRLQELSTYINSVWYSIFQISVSCYLLYRQLGVATLAGIAVIVLMLPATGAISKLMRRLQLKLMKVKDERIKVCHEVLSGIKVIKLQAWENSFTRRVMQFREDELSKLETYIYARCASITLFSAIPSLVTVASFLTYVLLGNTLDVGTALTSLALFDILRFPLFMLPQVLNAIVEASVSIQRLQDYFLEEERTKIGEGELKEVGVSVEDASFLWDAAPKRQEDATSSTDQELANAAATTSMSNISMSDFPVLRDVTLRGRSGQLIAIVGHVGSGKSTLLSGILGDARCSRGRVAVRGSVAYVSQQPFIQNATVRDNICFGRPFEQGRYDEAVRVSCLQKDLTILPGGDMTEIGEKGINLSGGQRTRVAIARAVYQNADIYVLDDILSAVDSHVGHDIFTQCIKQALAHKLVLLVTHGLTFLNQCDEILVLEKGTIVEHGSYSDLMAKQGVLTDLVSKYKDHDQAKTIEGVEEEQELMQHATDDAELEVDDHGAGNRSRTSSTRSDVTHEGELIDGSQLMVDEDRSTGDVAWSVYKVWIHAFGGMCAGSVIVVAFVLTQGINLSSTVWLSYWSDNAPNHPDSQMFYVYVFVGLNAAYAIALYVRSIITYSGGLRASKVLFNALLSRILRAPTSFFDTTPIGRIVNRLSKDVYTVDESIPATWAMLLNTIMTVAATLATISYVTPIFMVILVPVLVGYYLSQRYFIKTSRELQRLDSISRSPVFALLSETLDGLATIRAYGAEQLFSQRNEELLDRNQRAYFLNFAVNCWLTLRLEFAGTLIASFAALSAVLARGSSPAFAGLAGVSLSYAFSVTQSLSWSVRMVSQLQTQMVSVERIKNYSEMDTEASLTSVGRLPAGEWPTAGEIVFRGVNLRYRPGLPRVLRNLSMVIRPQEKIGIVGRTGAGKSSLVVALMRLVELDSGVITIDGVDLSTLGLHEVRSKISIIPQDPVLFSGTVRSNVDPFDQYTDDQIWTSLRRAHLDHAVVALDAKVDEKGNNFSVGERQLLCIARALLKRSRVILMDEATASIDTETDRKIQHSIREEFRDCTCLTIAHRINTIMDADRILVMDKGAVGFLCLGPRRRPRDQAVLLAYFPFSLPRASAVCLRVRSTMLAGGNHRVSPEVAQPNPDSALTPKIPTNMNDRRTFSKKPGGGRKPVLTPQEQIELYSPLRKKALVLLDTRWFTIMMLCVTIYAMFGDDVRVSSTYMSADNAFFALATICLVLFAFEFFLSCYAKPGYLFSFYFALDAIATFSVLPDIGWIWSQIVGTGTSKSALKASKATKAGSKAGRIVRVVRAVRLFRVVKILKWKHRDTEPTQLQESKVGSKMGEVTVQRVVILVLFLVMLLPVFDNGYVDRNYRYQDAGLHALHVYLSSGLSTNSSLFQNLFEGYVRDNKQVLFMMLTNMTNDTVVSKLRALHFNDTSSDSYAWRMAKYMYTYEKVTSNYRDTEISDQSEYGCYTTSFQSWDAGNFSSPCVSHVVFDISDDTAADAAYNIGKTCFIIALLVLASTVFIRTARQLVLNPIERMMAIVQKLAENPLASVQTSASDAETRKNAKEQGFETALLELTLSKVGTLMQVGFGAAGADIIGKNMGSGELDPMLPGKKITAIYGFCDIRQFTDTTECLQEDVMVYVNKLGNIMHTGTHHYYGMANKNVGDAFLLSWKICDGELPCFARFTDCPTEEDRNQVNQAVRCPPNQGAGSMTRRITPTEMADSALTAFIKCMIDLDNNNTDGCLTEYIKRDVVIKRFGPGFRIRMGFGMHVGWAVEGAIGSRFKIDATYISPHVEMADRLEAGSKMFGTPINISHWLAALLSPPARKLLRKMDRMSIRGVDTPITVYTFDVTVMKKGFGTPKIDPTTGLQQPVDFENDPEYMEIREGLEPAFLESAASAVDAYIAGDWAKARHYLTHAQQIRPQDGPCKYLMAVLKDNNFEAPTDWKGYRYVSGY
ncbi:TPA: hypothetical protein N0F65_002142 [Lagenidium giganteum]|uniref:Uncharacterized protein n=1 Tax=Lagenidium giganteum TaxID=4803 RepID=A0AAV2ZEQ2_9STRA|nr:TPA: hypothetical protein N0F65_002142 [Lagenidium giganteum]